jgi:hypothetical protein
VYKLPDGAWYPETEANAMLMCLYPNWVPEPVEGMTLMNEPVQDLFARAREMKPLLPIVPLEQQLEDMNAPKQLEDLLHLPLNPDGKKRLSASAVLKSPEYLGMRKAIYSLKYLEN